MTSIDLKPGERITRNELNQRFGGGIQGGMLTPKGGELMFLFSDPASGDTFGYTADGWADRRHTRYTYTGEGPVGPQAIDRGKNKILLETLHTEREVHLFYAVGTVEGSQTRIHEYLGQFDLDRSNPWHPLETTDQNGEPRTAVVFNLRRRDGSYPEASNGQTLSDTVATKTQVTEVDREAAENMRFERAAVDASKVERRERAMEDRLISWLEARGQETKRLRILPEGELHPLFTDTWVPSTQHLFEVKSDSTRNNIRMAVAQLLDYRRHIVPRPTQLTIVVPVQPSQDLLNFVKSTGLELSVFDSNGLTPVA